MTIAASDDARRVSFFAMEMRHLLAFVTVAQERHFGRAAERLGITQPPLSRQIQQLETELGLKLFVRNARAVELTPEGVSYLTAVRPHLAGLERAAEAAQAIRREPAGKVRVGLVSSLSYRFMPHLLAAMRRVAPNVGAELIEQSSVEQCRGVRERRLDVGLVFLPVEAGELNMRWLFREPLMVMLAAGHPLAASQEVALDALARESFIVCPRYRQVGFHETIVGLCRSTGFVPRVAHEASSSTMMAELVAAGLGLALVPRSATAHAHPGVIYQPLAGAPLVLEIAAVWLAEAMTPALRLFLDQAVKTARRA